MPSTRQNAPAVANNPSFSQPAPAAYATAQSNATEYAGASSTTATYATYAGEGGGGESSTDGGEGDLLLEQQSIQRATKLLRGYCSEVW